MSKRATYAVILTAIVFILYHCVLFLLAGLTDHTATFWLSYAAMLLSFASVLLSVLLMGSKTLRLRDWLFSWPLMKHSILFLIAEGIVSAIFMALEDRIHYAAALAAQLIVIGIYAVFAISCLSAQEAVKEIHEKIESTTTFMLSLRTKADYLARKDPRLTELQILAESLRYSDPVSNPALIALERELGMHIARIEEALNAHNTDQARSLCLRAQELLLQRNDYCKAMKNKMYGTPTGR